MPEVGRDAAERPYRSIREVLELLVGEFPDVTISKIRFLESRGLIHPERTPSGYRKFYDADVERLRWILRQQREHFLPLKIIKGRLDRGGLLAQLSTEPSLFDAAPEPAVDRAAADRSAPVPTAARPGGRGGGEEPPGDLGHANGAAARTSVEPNGAASTPDRPAEAPAPSATVEVQPVDVEPVEPQPVEEASGGAAPASARAATRGGGVDTAEEPAAPHSPQPRAAAGRPSTGRHRQPSNELSGATFSTVELAGASGASPELVTALVEYGLIASRVVAGVACFDEHALEVAKVAAGFARFGIEPRHLTAAKHAAQRQAGLYAQVVTPLLRQRNPEARAQAGADLRSLAELGGTLNRLLVDAALRELAGG